MSKRPKVRHVSREFRDLALGQRQLRDVQFDERNYQTRCLLHPSEFALGVEMNSLVHLVDGDLELGAVAHPPQPLHEIVDRVTGFFGQRFEMFLLRQLEKIHDSLAVIGLSAILSSHSWGSGMSCFSMGIGSR